MRIERKKLNVVVKNLLVTFTRMVLAHNCEMPECILFFKSMVCLFWAY